MTAITKLEELQAELDEMVIERDAQRYRAEQLEMLAETQIAIDLYNKLNAAVDRAQVAEAALAQCQAWRQEDADNLNHCIRAKQKLADERATLRRALAQLVGADTIEELRNMEAVMRAAPAPAKDKAAAIDAIHALIEVQP